MKTITPRVALTLAVGAAVLPVAQASGDAFLQPPSESAAVNMRFSEPVLLRPHVVGEVRTAQDAEFRGTAYITVGDKVITRPKVASRETTTAYRPLRLTIYKWQRSKVRDAVRATGRRAVLNVRGVAQFENTEDPAVHLREFVMSIR